MKSNRKLPAARPLHVSPFRNERDELFFALQDMTQVAPQPIAVSLPAYFILTQLDGENTCDDVQAAFLTQFGQIVTAEQITQMVETLDEALMLDSPRFVQAYVERRRKYLAAKTRDNRDRYASGQQLWAYLEQMLGQGSATPTADLRGIIAPHLDYARGGTCYADAYATLKQAPPAERYVILGTNHFGQAPSLVATTKDFQTPLGLVETDREFIGRLETALHRSTCEHQFDHHAEHSVELQVHLLQVLHRGSPFAIVPLLCPDPSNPAHDQSHSDCREFADALAELLAQDERRTVLIAAADLSHVGQRFGDEQATTAAFLEQVGSEDRQLLDMLETRQEEQFVESLRAAGNLRRVCSAGCIYTLLRALPTLSCRVLRYEQAVDMEKETHVTCFAAAVGS